MPFARDIFHSTTDGPTEMRWESPDLSQFLFFLGTAEQACHPNLFVVGEVISQTALYSVCKGDLHMTYAFGVQGEGVGKFTEEQKFVNL